MGKLIFCLTQHRRSKHHHRPQDRKIPATEMPPRQGPPFSLADFLLGGIKRKSGGERGAAPAVWILTSR
jgi:hypothetical protein